MTYEAFLQDKAQIGRNSGFEPLWIPDFLFDFQKSLCEWAITKGRGAIFADCGLGKTPMQLVWSQNVVQHTNKPVLILTPYLGVGSEAYGAVINNRKAIGWDTKPAYYAQAVKNLAAAANHREIETASLFQDETPIEAISAE